MYFLVKGKFVPLLMQINMRLTVAPRKSALSGRDSGGDGLADIVKRCPEFLENFMALGKELTQECVVCNLVMQMQ